VNDLIQDGSAAVSRETDSDALRILQQAAVAWGDRSQPRPSADSLVPALLALETQAKGDRRSFSFDALSGQWRLWFTTGVRKQSRGGIALGKGFYVPRLAVARIGFQQPELASSDEHPTTIATPLTESQFGTITNQAQVGRLRLELSGPCRYQPKKNLLAFDFTHVTLSLFGRTLYQGSIRGGEAKAKAFPQQRIGTLPFFAFFSITDDYIAARGRGGGLALWIREGRSPD
jgi:hypothetical protein